MPTKGHTSIIMLMYAPCWLRPLKSAVNGRLRHVYKTTGDVHPGFVNAPPNQMAQESDEIKKKRKH